MTDLRISAEALDPAGCIRKATDPECGGIAVFIGAVRKSTRGKEVVRLEYESYEPMALKEMKKIADEALRQWQIRNLVIHHRTGNLQVGDIAVVIVAAAPHREAAFDACRYAIDTLKKTVPFWKKEVFEDGGEWV